MSHVCGSHDYDYVRKVGKTCTCQVHSTITSPNETISLRVDATVISVVMVMQTQVETTMDIVRVTGAAIVVYVVKKKEVLVQEMMWVLFANLMMILD